MSPSALFKVEGTGNDFVLGLGTWARRLAEDADLAAALCHRRTGIGADGTLALLAEDQTQLRLVYRNSDGAVASFCANGTRCAARAAVELLGLDERLEIITGWHTIPAEVDGINVTLDLPAPPAPPQRLELETTSGKWSCSHLVLGVPHLVIRHKDLEGLDISEVAPELRRHPKLGDDGANVNFINRQHDGLHIRSWERGVEAETLCCGSGVVAAALVVLADEGGTVLEVLPKSADALKVEAQEPAPLARTRLTGPARIVAEIVPGVDFFRTNR